MQEVISDTGSFHEQRQEKLAALRVTPREKQGGAQGELGRVLLVEGLAWGKAWRQEHMICTEEDRSLAPCA